MAVRHLKGYASWVQTVKEQNEVSRFKMYESIRFFNSLNPRNKTSNTAASRRNARRKVNSYR